jgi:hypothetical protein
MRPGASVIGPLQLGAGRDRPARFWGDSEEQELLAQAPGIYRRLQDANNTPDPVQITRLVEQSYLPVPLNALPNRIKRSCKRVLSLQIQVHRRRFFSIGWRWISKAEPLTISRRMRWALRQKKTRPST